jgi:hypothetical protein
MNEEYKDKEKTDEEYWLQFKRDEDSFQTHDIDLEIVCKFNGINHEVIYKTEEKAINCNLEDLELWFSNLKKTIRMLDESISDKEVGEGL